VTDQALPSGEHEELVHYVHVGNLPWDVEKDVVEEWLVRQLVDMQLHVSPADVFVVPFQSGKKRKKRDIGKMHRGFAYIAFREHEADDEANVVACRETARQENGERAILAVNALNERELYSKSIRASRAAVVPRELVQGLNSRHGTSSPEEDQEDLKAKQDALEGEKLLRRAHRKRRRGRLRKLQSEEDEALLSRLLHASTRLPRGKDAGGPLSRTATLQVVDVDVACRTLYSTWKSQKHAAERGFLSWSTMSRLIDPSWKPAHVGRGPKHENRVLRKRLQVESFVSILRAANLLQPGQTVVDFGSGTGNLVLPLAFAFPHCDFVAVDKSDKAIAFLNERASDAGLSNVKGFAGCIEDFGEMASLRELHPDVVLALHVCGAGTDYAIQQAKRIGASFCVSPCCIGKMQHVVLGRRHGGDDALTGNQLQQGSMRYPRSTWARKLLSTTEHIRLAKMADFSGHNGVSGYDMKSQEGKLPRAAKTLVEYDRQRRCDEDGYATYLLKLLEEDSCVKNDIIVGFPSREVAETFEQHLESQRCA